VDQGFGRASERHPLRAGKEIRRNLFESLQRHHAAVR
jgi:hypothetical protein